MQNYPSLNMIASNQISPGMQRSGKIGTLNRGKFPQLKPELTLLLELADILK